VLAVVAGLAAVVDGAAVSAAVVGDEPAVEASSPQAAARSANVPVSVARAIRVRAWRVGMVE
jgi:hypothetical protein